MKREFMIAAAHETYMECLRKGSYTTAERVAAVVAAGLRVMADEIDRGPTFPIPPSVVSALVRERAASLDATAGGAA